MWVAESLKIPSGFIVLFIQRKTKVNLEEMRERWSSESSSSNKRWTGAYVDYNGLKKNTGSDLAVQAKQAPLNTFEIHTPQINFAQTLQTSVD